MKTKESFKMIANLQFKFISDIDGGEILDTRIEIVDRDTLFVCVIEGANIEGFIGDLECFFNKYRI